MSSGNTNRRRFLGLALAAGAGTAAAPLIGAATGGNTSGERQKVLTADGRLVEVDLGAAVSTHHPVTNQEARQGIPGRRWVMVIDLAKCDGCGSCSDACSAMHYVPPDRQWIPVLKMKDSPETAPYWFPKPCFHCDNPPCTKVCPVDATFKRQDGIVLIDNERCIGCRFCMAACPYSARSFNWSEPQEPPAAAGQPYSPEYGFPRRKGTVEKCDFCPHMAAIGKLPACASACPMGVIYYGDENEDAVTNAKGETERLSQLLADRAGYRFLEELGTHPRVYYLPPKQRMFPGPGGEEEAS
jgi:Fe-S-cluster-containing dehydrogenase component